MRFFYAFCKIWIFIHILPLAWVPGGASLIFHCSTASLWCAVCKMRTACPLVLAPVNRATIIYVTLFSDYWRKAKHLHIHTYLLNPRFNQPLPLQNFRKQSQARKIVVENGCYFRGAIPSSKIFAYPFQITIPRETKENLFSFIRCANWDFQEGF